MDSWTFKMNHIWMLNHIVACQVHPALVEWSCVTRFYVNVSPLVHLSVSSRITIVSSYSDMVHLLNGLKGSRTVSCRRPGAGFYWRPRLPGTRQYLHWKQNKYSVSQVLLDLIYMFLMWLNEKVRGGPINCTVHNNNSVGFRWVQQCTGGWFKAGIHVL